MSTSSISSEQIWQAAGTGGGGGGGACFMPGTLMTLADGSQKKIEEIDKILNECN